MAPARGVFGRWGIPKTLVTKPWNSDYRMSDLDTDEELWVSRSFARRVSDNPSATTHKPRTWRGLAWSSPASGNRSASCRGSLICGCPGIPAVFQMQNRDTVEELWVSRSSCPSSRGSLICGCPGLPPVFVICRFADCRGSLSCGCPGLRAIGEGLAVGVPVFYH